MAEQRRGNKLGRRSDVWEHFILFTDDHGNEKARCKRCGQVLNASQGTSSPKKHVKICPGQGAATGVSEPPPCDPPRLAESSHRQPIPQNEADDHEPGLNHKEASRDLARIQPQSQPQQIQLQPSGPGESSDCEPAGVEQDEASRDLARMIALHGYDPSVVEDDYFKSFVLRLNPGFEMPPREAIDEMCAGIFQGHKKDLFLSSKHAHGRFSLAMGIAKTIEAGAGQVVYTVCRFVDEEWNLHKVVMDACVVLPLGDYYHTPLGLPVVSLDNEVEYVLSDIPDGENLFMIAVGLTGIISHIKLKVHLEKKLRSVFPSEMNIELFCTTYVDHVLHSIARCLLPDSEFAKDIFTSVKPIRGSSARERQELLSQLGLDDPWQYNEHWYSCYCSLEVLAHKFPGKDTESRKLLRSLWRETYRAIKRVYDSIRTTSNSCLEELFKVRNVLQSQLSEATAAHAGKYRGFGNKNVTDVLREALQNLDKAIQDSYLVWSIPLVLDPRYKLRYIKFNFERAFDLGVANYYTSEVRRKTKALYTSYIEDHDKASGYIIEDMAVDNTISLEQAWDVQCRLQDGAGKVGSHEEAEAELDRYLEDRLVPGTENFDVLKWWKENSWKYPTVAQMARDALAMPTCSKLSSDQIALVRSMVRLL